MDVRHAYDGDDVQKSDKPVRMIPGTVTRGEKKWWIISRERAKAECGEEQHTRIGTSLGLVGEDMGPANTVGHGLDVVLTF